MIVGQQLRNRTIVGYYGAPIYTRLRVGKGVRTVADFRDRIVLNPKIRGGKPIIRGTRITVADILEYLAGGMSP
ncbi:MAG: DUF433 domain-containing protein, partial [Sulfobacillus sp.]